MKSIKSFVKPVVMAAVVLCGAGSVQAQQMMPPGMMPQGMMMPQQMMPQPMAQQQMMPQAMMPQGMMQQQINPLAMLRLTEDQQKQLVEIGKEAQKQGMEFMKKIGESSQALPMLMMEVTPDPKIIGEAYAKMFEIQRQMIEAAVAVYNKQLAVFTEEQRTLWNAMRKQMHGAPAAKK